MLLLALSACASRPHTTGQQAGSSFTQNAKYHPSVLAAKERSEQAKSAETAARADLLPQVSLNASASAYSYDNSPTTPRVGTANVGVNISVPISKAFAGIAGVEVASSSRKASIEALRASNSDVLVRIATAVANVDRAQDTVAARGAHLSELGKFLKEQNRRHTAGFASKTDLAQVKGRIAASSAEYSRALANKSDAVSRLASLLGHAPSSDLKLIDPRKYLPRSENEAVRYALKDNPSIRELEWRRQVASKQVNVSAMNIGPEVNLTANFNGDENYYSDDSLVSSNDAHIRLGLSVPLFDGGKRISNVKSKLSALRESQYEGEAGRRNIEAETRSNWYQLEAATSALSFANDRLDAAKRAFAGVREARRIGAKTTQDELNAHSELTQALLAQSQAKYDIMVFGHQLLSNMGRVGWAYNLAEQSTKS